MSSTVSLERLWPVLENTDLAFFVSAASTALVLYEYAITIGLEAQQIWNREVSTAMALFLLTRYITVLDRILVVLSVLSPDTLEACKVVTWLQGSTTSMLMVVMSAIAAIRIFALWNRDSRLLAVIMIPGLFPPIANLYFRSASTVLLVPSNVYACQTVPMTISALVYKGLSIAARAVAILVDGTVVILTWLKTYRIFVLTRGITSRTNYSTLILRDGTLYFLAVCGLNLAAIVYVMHTGSNVLNDLIVTLSSILMSRFLLNLRRHRTRTERQSTTSMSSMGILSRHFSAPKFSSDASYSVTQSMIGGDTADDSPNAD